MADFFLILQNTFKCIRGQAVKLAPLLEKASLNKKVSLH